MIRNIFLICIGLIIINTNTHGNHSSSNSPQDSSRAFKEEFIQILKATDPSLVGRTPEGNNYNLYAIKKRKQWTFIILDSTSYYSIKQVKEQVTENPPSYTEMFCLMAKAKMIKKNNKPINISGLTLSCYYKFKPSAKKMYRSFNKIQRKVNFYQVNLNDGNKGMMKILNQNLK